MSDKKKELPRDLRALCGGTVEDADGSQRTLIFPADSYANICEVRKGLEHAIAHPDTRIEDIESLRSDLEAVKREEVEMEQRILNHFDPQRPASISQDQPLKGIKIDHEAKSKLEKAITDAKAGRYDRKKKSKTLQAVLQAFAFCQKNGRMPSHDELKGLKALNGLNFNDQQATDAGKWLSKQADPNPDNESLFSKLTEETTGRPPKK